MPMFLTLLTHGFGEFVKLAWGYEDIGAKIESYRGILKTWTGNFRDQRGGLNGLKKVPNRRKRDQKDKLGTYFELIKYILEWIRSVLGLFLNLN